MSGDNTSGSDMDLIVELEEKLGSGSSSKAEKLQKHDLISAEIKGLARHLNNELADDDLARPYLPIQVDEVDLLDKVSDGVLHCAFIRCLAPDIIAKQKIITSEHKGRPLNTFEMQANQRLYIEAAVSYGLVVVNIGDSDLIHARQHVSLVLGLLWQLLDRQLRQRTGLQRCPRQRPTLDEHKQLVIEWINKRLSPDTAPIVRNFTTDLQDGRIYLMLLRSICPPSMIVSKPSHFNDDQSRAQAVIGISTKMGLNPLFDHDDIILGHEQLNYVFIQSLIGWCRIREQSSNTDDIETQANISIQSMEQISDQIHNTPHRVIPAQNSLVVVERSGPGQYLQQQQQQQQQQALVFHYLGMTQQYLIQVQVQVQGLAWVGRRHAGPAQGQAGDEIRSGTRTKSVNIWRWALWQMMKEGRGAGGTRETDLLSSTTRSALRSRYWSVSLLPGLESIGPVFTRSVTIQHDTQQQYIDIIAALTAAAIGRTLIAPLETIQIRKQVNQPGSGAGSGSGSGPAPALRALLRGHSANLGRLLPYTAIQFLACNHEEIARGQYASLILATGLATLLTYPLDAVQTQMAASTAPGGISRYIWNSARTHGLLPGLFRGVLPHGLGATAFISMHLITEPHLRDIFQPELAGLFSFMSCLIATYPARTIGRRMQIGLLHNQPLHSMMTIVYDSVQRQGLQGLYKGIVPALAKATPVYLCTAATFHLIHRS